MSEAALESAIDEFRKAAAKIRGNAKWAIGALGAVGAILVAGLGLSSLTGLTETWQYVTAIGGIVIALVGVAWAILQTTAVLAPSTVVYADVVAAERQSEAERPKYLAEVLVNRDTLLSGFAATNFADFGDEVKQALADRVEALNTHYDDPDDETKFTNAQAKQARATLYGKTHDAIVARAAYGEIKGRLSVARMIAAGALVALGVGIFAVTLAVGPDQTDDASSPTAIVVRSVSSTAP